MYYGFHNQPTVFSSFFFFFLFCALCVKRVLVVMFFFHEIDQPKKAGTLSMIVFGLVSLTLILTLVRKKIISLYCGSVTRWSLMPLEYITQIHSCCRCCYCCCSLSLFIYLFTHSLLLIDNSVALQGIILVNGREESMSCVYKASIN